jgi:hypothetical protein
LEHIQPPTTTNNNQQPPTTTNIIAWRLMPPQFHKLKQLKLIYPKSILKHGILALRDGY